MQNSSQQITDLGNGIQRETLHDGRLVIFTANGAKRETIDVWYTNVIAQMATYQPGNTYALMHDFSHPNAVLTPYARNRATEVARQVPKTNMNYAALVVQRGLVGQTYQLFMRMVGGASHLETRVFFNREQGLEWLSQKLSEADKK